MCVWCECVCVCVCVCVCGVSMRVYACLTEPDINLWEFASDQYNKMHLQYHILWSGAGVC